MEIILGADVVDLGDLADTMTVDISNGTATCDGCGAALTSSKSSYLYAAARLVCAACVGRLKLPRAPIALVDVRATFTRTYAEDAWCTVPRLRAEGPRAAFGAAEVAAVPQTMPWPPPQQAAVEIGVALAVADAAAHAKGGAPSEAALWATLAAQWDAIARVTVTEADAMRAGAGVGAVGSGRASPPITIPVPDAMAGQRRRRMSSSDSSDSASSDASMESVAQKMRAARRARLARRGMMHGIRTAFPPVAVDVELRARGWARDHGAHATVEEEEAVDGKLADIDTRITLPLRIYIERGDEAAELWSGGASLCNMVPWALLVDRDDPSHLALLWRYATHRSYVVLYDNDAAALTVVREPLGDAWAPFGGASWASLGLAWLAEDASVNNAVDDLLT